MAMDVAHVVEDDRVRFVLRWPKHPTDLLEVEAQGLRWPQQDGARSRGYIEALTNHVDRDQHLELTASKARHNAIAVYGVSGAEESGCVDPGCVERFANVFCMAL